MPKSVVTFLVVFAAMLVAGSSKAEEMKLVADKSKIEFVGSKPDGKHDGGFKKFDAKMNFVPESRKDSKLTIDIETASLFSDDPRLTNHLKSPDFFDVRKHDKIKFETVEMMGPEKEGKKPRIKGKLTMLGKTEEIVIPVDVKRDGKTVQMAAEFEIDRTKWGMDYGQGKINNEVKIKAQLVFAR